MYILGLSAYYHDSAACLLKDGEIIAAAQEERFTRVKHDPAFPKNAISYCLKQENISLDDVEYIVFYDKPFLKFERLLETYIAFAPRGFVSFSKALPLWIKEKLFQKSLIITELGKFSGNHIEIKNKLLFNEHHLSHAASAFFPSPFKNSAVLTMDGVGEWSTTSVAVGNDNKLKILKEINFPHSLGLLYSAFTYYLGFKVNSGEYKVMGLAPYGKPIYQNKIMDNLISIKSDGSFALNMKFFNYCTGLTMTNKHFDKLFGAPARKSETDLKQRDMDLAASIQAVTEEVVLNLARTIAKDTGEKNLCLAGGVALNCVANGVLKKEKIFENIWIQPASGDAGGSLGAALSAYYIMLKNKRKVVSGRDTMRGSYLGPDFKDAQSIKELKKIGAKFYVLSDKQLIENASEALKNGKALGWMTGRMEFGPRALGGRSILADPRSPFMQKNLNLKVKFRESFRPFAPSILEERVSDWFEMEGKSPYMLLVAKVKRNRLKKINKKNSSLFGIDLLNIPRSQVPAITHVDNSARVQTVNKRDNPKYYKLINSFYKKTGCPILVNTSFNVRGEPIVCNVNDAFKCFMGTDLDTLVIGNLLLYKNEQDSELIESYKDKYELD